jgi:DNA-binding XRE family transcriptional regulator
VYTPLQVVQQGLSSGSVQAVAIGQEGPVNKSIGEIVRERRKEMGWSQEHLGRVCGVTRSYIRGIECGKTDGSPVVREMLAKVLADPSMTDPFGWWTDGRSYRLTARRNQSFVRRSDRHGGPA